MDLSVSKWQDPKPGLSGVERRRRIRQRLHTPVYASFKGPNQGMVLDLSELVDIHEEGFAVQTSAPLEINRPVNIFLDLTETKALIHGTGHVVWSDGAGRGGIRLSALPDQSVRRLKEWLFVNLLIALANHAARAEQLAHVAEEIPRQHAALLESGVPEPVPDMSALASAVDAVRLELRAHRGDFSGVLQLITERALSLTGARGAALAFLTNGEIICRGRAGDLAPPLGSAVDATHGFSGECIRSGSLIACEDTESDSRVDREICRMIGIGSMLAAPILSDWRVVGLLEVFSPQPHSFTKIHKAALERLAELIPKVEPPPPAPSEPPDDQALPASSETPVASPKQEALSESQAVRQELRSGVPIRRRQLGLLVAGVAVVAVAALALGFFVGQKHWLTKPGPAQVQAAARDASPSTATPIVAGTTSQDLRKLAEQGSKEAQWDLGVRYHTGEGVPQDDSQAVHWFLRAAEQGHVLAQATLGAYYWAGRGVPRDLSKAYFWSVLALAQGDEASKSRLQGLASQMTRAQVITARQQAEVWIRQHTHGAKTN